MQQGYNLQSTLLKVGHHGSDTSSTPEFIQRVKPKYAVISCGIDNKFGHPKALTLKTLQAEQTVLYRTDLSGAVCFTTDGKKLQIRSYHPVPSATAYHHQ